MLITLHMFSLSVVCTLNTQLKLLPFKRYTVLRRTVNGNFVLTPTVPHLCSPPGPAFFGIFGMADNYMKLSHMCCVLCDEMVVPVSCHVRLRLPVTSIWHVIRTCC